MGKMVVKMNSRRFATAAADVATLASDKPFFRSSTIAGSVLGAVGSLVTAVYLLGSEIRGNGVKMDESNKRMDLRMDESNKRMDLRMDELTKRLHSENESTAKRLHSENESTAKRQDMRMDEFSKRMDETARHLDMRLDETAKRLEGAAKEAASTYAATYMAAMISSGAYGKPGEKSE
jgi:hypothetical protein